MTNKERLVCLLDGGIPDIPPHFEIDFHLSRELFGLEPPESYRIMRDEYQRQCDAWTPSAQTTPS